MTEWRETTLGDVLTLQRGFDITKREQRPGPVPVVSSSGVSSYHEEPRVKAPGVVIGRKGSLGTVFFLEDPFWPHDTTLWVKDFRGNDPYFCYLLLRTLPLAELDAGSSNPTLNRNHAHTLRVWLPDVGVQRRIAAVLSAFDELIAINERRIELLEDLARSLYREWFVRLRFPGHNSTIDGLPDGWQRRPASQVFTVNPRIRSDQTAFPKVTMGDVDERFAIVFPSEVVARASGSRFQRDDVLFARITPCLENGKTALAKFLEPGVMGVGSTEFIVLRGVRVGPAFTYCAARSDPVRQHAIKSMSGASGRQRVASNAFDALGLVEPSANVAEAFEQSFQLAAAGGPADGATTEVVVVPVHGHCMDCRADFESPDPSPACPSCGSLDVAAEGGDDIVLAWLQYVDTTAPSDRSAELVPAHTHAPADAKGA